MIAFFNIVCLHQAMEWTRCVTFYVSCEQFSIEFRKSLRYCFGFALLRFVIG